jgi:hypothetical protein
VLRQSSALSLKCHQGGSRLNRKVYGSLGTDVTCHLLCGCMRLDIARTRWQWTTTTTSRKSFRNSPTAVQDGFMQCNKARGQMTRHRVEFLDRAEARSNPGVEALFPASELIITSQIRNKVEQKLHVSTFSGGSRLKKGCGGSGV